MRLPHRFPPPESNAYIILGCAGILLGLGIIYNSIYPSTYDLSHPNAYHHPTILRGVGWLITGFIFLIPSINRRIRK